MPNSKRDHSENRRVVCLLCMTKGKTMRKITRPLHEVIEENVLEGYDPNDERLPTAVCSTCFTVLHEYKKGCYKRKIQLFDFANLKNLRPTTRNQDECTCTVCEIGRSSIESIASGGFTKKRPPAGRPPIDSGKSEKMRPIKICGACLSFISRGTTHACTMTVRTENLKKFVEAGSQNSKEQVACSILKEKLQTSPSFTSSFSQPKGRPFTVTSPQRSDIAGGKRDEVLINADDLGNVQMNLGLSTNQTRTLSSHIRAATGRRNSVQLGSRQILQEKSHQLDQHFLTENHQFCKNGEENLQNKPLVRCAKLSDFIEYVKDKRGIENGNDVLLKVGIDGGRNFLKVCLNIQSLTQSIEPEDSINNCSVKQKKLRDGGVKKLMILAIAHDVQENFRNMLTICTALDLHSELESSPDSKMLSCDLKLINLLLGLMGHGSNHPCAWCDAERRKLDMKGKARTFGSLRSNFWNFFNSGESSSKAKQFGNSLHLPILRCADDIRVLEKFPPPELHLMIGIVSKLFNELMKKWDGAEKWLSEIHVDQESYHGGSFTGNSAKKLLKNINKLEEIAEEEMEVCQSFVDAFKSFEKVVDACFGMDLTDGFQASIQEFHNAYKKLNIPVTPKVHVVLFHVQDFCEEFGRGLGFYSEQASESVHQDFDSFWERFKVNKNNPQFGSHLLRAVSSYNAQHL